MKITCSACEARHGIGSSEALLRSAAAPPAPQRRDSVSEPQLGLTARCERCGAPTSLDVSRARDTRGEHAGNSVLFSLANLRDLASSPTRPPSPERSGLIDIRMLAAPSRPSAEPAIDLLLSLAQPIPVAPPASAPPALAPRIAIAVVTVALAALGGSLAVMQTSHTRGPVPHITEAPAPIEPVALAPIAPAPVSPPASLPVPAPSAPLVAARPAPRPRPRPTPDVPTVEHSVHGTSRPAARPMPVIEPADILVARAPPMERLRDAPTLDEVRRAMESLTPAVHECAVGVRGHALLSVTVLGESGHVRSVTVRGDVAETSAASCIERAARRLELAPFARATFTVWFPYAL